jgi:hypothetical protein
MLVHRIILNTNKKPTMKKTTNIIKTIKEKVILISFGINLLVCFTSCAYFSAADSKMREYRQIQQDAHDALNPPSLFGDMHIEELENAVRQDIKDLEKKVGAKVSKR